MASRASTAIFRLRGEELGAEMRMGRLLRYRF